MVSRIGIRREDKNEWERRVPLSPSDVESLRREHGIEFSLQPFPSRAFSDEEFLSAGAMIDESLEGCSVILGIKEMPLDFFKRGLTYLFFSHTIKGQKHNMPMLRKLLELGCNLIDYEKITDEEGRRLVFFGSEAGQAGMIDTLWALGRRLQYEGIANPFADIRQALEYGVLAEAEKAIQAAGERLSSEGVPPAIHPLVVGFAGYGNVSKGAQRVLENLPVKEVSPAELLRASAQTFASRQHVYKVVFHEKDMVMPLREGDEFDLQEYYEHPERYRGVFERYVPMLTVLMNCITWKPIYPRLVTKKLVRRMYGGGVKPRLKVIGDISCDLEGAIEVTMRVTNSGNPVFVFDVDKGEPRDGVEGRGPVILAVDNLPCELPRESSARFSSSLAPFVPHLAKADFSAEFEKLEIIAPLKRAIVCYHGKLTPAYEYLKDHL